MSLDVLRGRINDADSHEMIPPKLWPESFGTTGEMLLTFMTSPEIAATLEEAMSFYLDEVDTDSLEITDETVWKHSPWGQQGARAPGAIDMERRVQVLDFMGVRAQQIFPTFGLFGMILSTAGPAYMEKMFGAAMAAGLDIDLLRAASTMILRAHNDWTIAQSKIDDRLRFVAVIDTSDLTQMMEETERVLAGGVKALFIPASVPPGGKSPADEAMAPFWSLCEEADVTVQLHIANESFMRTDVWGRVPQFELSAIKSLEFIVDPWTLATVHLPIENYLTTMILGGVFERHPRLRFGAIECGAHWVGPLAECLDMWAGVAVKQKQLQGVLSMPPSAYLRRNVRVTPFYFEPVDMYIERYGLEDVLCYGSDYPHPEGGKDSLEILAAKIAPLGDDVMEKFFVSNAELIMS